MPPKLNDGGFVLFRSESGQTFRFDEIKEMISDDFVHLEYDSDPIDLCPREMTLTAHIYVKQKQIRRFAKALHAAANRQKRAIRTEKRQREKERRRKVKEDKAHGNGVDY